jgi:hypothetical protein
MRRPRGSPRLVPLRFVCRRVRFRVMLVKCAGPDLLRGIDLTELDLPTTMKTHFEDPADLLNFTLTITPDEGACAVSVTKNICILTCTTTIMQACTRAAHSDSHLPSTPTTHTSHQKSSARRLSALPSQGLIYLPANFACLADLSP